MTNYVHKKAVEYNHKKPKHNVVHIYHLLCDTEKIQI